MAWSRRHDTQHDDIQYNDKVHNGTLHDGFQHNANHHKNATLSITTISKMAFATNAKCHYD
jgi:hypothetical protein